MSELRDSEKRKYAFEEVHSLEGQVAIHLFKLQIESNHFSTPERQTKEGREGYNDERPEDREINSKNDWGEVDAIGLDIPYR